MRTCHVEAGKAVMAAPGSDWFDGLNFYFFFFLIISKTVFTP